MGDEDETGGGDRFRMSKPALKTTPAAPNSSPMLHPTPALVSRLIELCSDEETALNELCAAVSDGDEKAIFNSAKRLAELRTQTPDDAGNAENCGTKTR